MSHVPSGSPGDLPTPTPQVWTPTTAAPAPPPPPPPVSTPPPPPPPAMAQPVHLPQPAMMTVHSSHWYQPEEKSLAVAYLLWFFFGLFGVHQFYLGKIGRGVGYIFTAAWFTIAFWVDLFTLPSQVNAINARSRWEHRSWTYAQPTATPVPRAATAPPDWYSDPTNPAQLRWWDGSAWTHHVTGVPGTSGAGVVGEDPPALGQA